LNPEAIASLTAASFVAGAASWGILWGIEQILGTQGFLIVILELAIAGLGGLGVFALIATQLKLEEVDIFVDRVRQKLGR